MMQLREYQIELIEKVKESYRNGHKRPCIVAPCGAGKSIIVADIAKKATDKGNRVLFLVHRRELCEQIEETFINYGVNMKFCTIGMVQTLTKRIEKMDNPTLIITDENHHCLAKSYKKIYEHFSDALCVGVTATPARINGGGLADINDDLIIGPDVCWLIDNGFLSAFDYFAPKTCDLTGLKIKQGEFVVSDIEKRMLKKAVFGDVIKNYRELAKDRQAICYCASINYSKRMADEFDEAGIISHHIDGETPPCERKRIIESFRAGEIKILCNVDLISEGFDVPDCGCSILLRPTQSLTLHIQQSMRCMRFKEGKRAVIIDHVGNYARHGLPDTKREWTLEAKKAKKHTEPDEYCRQCTQCYYAHEPASICPNCGYEYPKKERSIEEIKEAALEKITGIVIDYSNPSDCKTIKELQLYGKNKGYKPGWAYYQAKQRGIV